MDDSLPEIILNSTDRINALIVKIKNFKILHCQRIFYILDRS